MKKTLASKTNDGSADDLAPEYRFDYRQARPNRFAARSGQGEDRLVVALDPDVARVFTTPEAVNTMLRALITSMPKPRKRKAARS